MNKKDLKGRLLSPITISLLGLGVLVSATAFILAIPHIPLWESLWNRPKTQPLTQSVSEDAIAQVTALGRLEPQGEIIELSAPATSQRLAQLRVNLGDTVEAGQIIAIMDGLAARQADLNQAQARVNVAQARLLQVQAGQAPGEIEAQNRQVRELQAQLKGDLEVQQTEIDRHNIELQKVQVDYERYQQLAQDGLVPQSQVDEKRLQLSLIRKQIEESRISLDRRRQTGQEQIQTAQARLKTVSEVRPNDIAVAQAELSEAIAALKTAQANLDTLYVRSPLRGQILSINTNVGEKVGSQGIVAIGQTQQMYAIAEVYESDIQYVKVGQSATIVSEYGGFEGTLNGIVERIGLQIDRPGIVNDDPSARADVRVVKVAIRLDPEDSDRVNALNKLQVRVSIII